MRLLLLLLGLAVLFAGAHLVQTRWVSGMRRDRLVALRASTGATDLAEEALPGWVPRGQALVLIGRPSGAEPLAVDPIDPAFEAEDVPFEVWEEERHESLGDFELEVHSGQTLSEIVLGHYGVLDGELIEGLAAYNGLLSADALRVGERLRLPDVRALRALAE